LLNCAPQTEQQTQPVAVEGRTIEADVEAIKDLNEKWGVVYRAGDADALGSYYTDDVIIMSPNSPLLRGKDAALAEHKSFLDQYTVEGQAPSADVRVSGNLAVARGTYTWTNIHKADGSSVTDIGKWLAVFQRQSDGSWKYSWDIWNSDTEPAAPTS
jgi:uncharacterized protein (TIGR02246 family)